LAALVDNVVSGAILSAMLVETWWYLWPAAVHLETEAVVAWVEPSWAPVALSAPVAQLERAEPMALVA
jgi:hypothetical protein